ncbi:MAG TPA: 50S ribosomal protein L4 [Fimbriimonadales bacterium]|nr:50S ribosomal protein L4 [Fimbriimonadales bacterium]
MKLKVLDSKGKEKGEITLGEAFAKSTPNKWLLHRVVVAEEANQRQGTHKVLTRAEVRGGGRKPWRQKKTGRARQGSIRAPHWRHGGVVHGPVVRSYAQKINKKEKRLALQEAFVAKVNSNDVVVVDEIRFEEPKTKKAVELLNNVGVNGARTLVILPEYDEMALLSFRNLPNVEVRTAPARPDEKGNAPRTQAFSTRDLLVARKIVVAKEALSRIQEAWSE